MHQLRDNPRHSCLHRLPPESRTPARVARRKNQSRFACPHIPELSNCSQRPNLHQPNGRTLISLSDVMAVVMGELRKSIQAKRP